MIKHQRDQQVKANIALLITSDTRNKETDETGKTAINLLKKNGHKIIEYRIVPNDDSKIKKSMKKFLDDENIDVIITSGGTGISSRDKTVDAVSPLFEKSITGFGELFRKISYDEIGEAAIISRSIAGISNGKLIFCLPGSKSSMNLALDKIILPVIGHMLWEVNR